MLIIFSIKPPYKQDFNMKNVEMWKNVDYAINMTKNTLFRYKVSLYQILSINSFATAAYSREPLPYGSW